MLSNKISEKKPLYNTQSFEKQKAFIPSLRQIVLCILYFWNCRMCYLSIHLFSYHESQPTVCAMIWQCCDLLEPGGLPPQLITTQGEVIHQENNSLLRCSLRALFLPFFTRLVPELPKNEHKSGLGLRSRKSELLDRN